MATNHRERVRAVLRALPVDEFAGFVVELSRARGHDAAVVDARTIRIDDRRVHVHRPRWMSSFLPVRVPDAADAVVTPRVGRPRGVPADVPVIDGDALYELAVFGIDDADRRRLFEAFLDRSGPDVDLALSPGASAGTAAAGDASVLDRSSRVRTLHAVIGVLALALVAAAVVGLPAAPDDGAQPAGDTIDTLTPFDATGNVDGPAVGASPPGVSDAPAAAPVPTPEPPPADAYTGTRPGRTSNTGPNSRSARRPGPASSPDRTSLTRSRRTTHS